MPPPPHTHTPREGMGLIRLTLHTRKLLMGANLFGGTTQYQKVLLSPKINQFGLHKIAWCPWQPITHNRWAVCKQAQDRHLGHILSLIFFSSTNSRKASCQLYPGIQFRLPCTTPGQFFLGAKLFIGTPWMGNEGVLNKILVWAM